MTGQKSTRTKILFVCLGNICRSPMAEGVFTNLVEQSGRADEFMIDSAGTGSWHVGQQPNNEGQRAIKARGIDISGQRCRQVDVSDFAEFDLLIAMDTSNHRNLVATAPRGTDGKVHLLLDYAQAGVREVPDPWGEGGNAFDHALDLIEEGCAGLLASLAVK